MKVVSLIPRVETREERINRMILAEIIKIQKEIDEDNRTRAATIIIND